MLKKIREYVSKWHMLEKGDKVIAGVSGGADSVCLLFVLLELQKEIPFEMIVVHVNHGLRGMAAQADEKYVKELCRQKGILCITYFENVELIAKNRRQSTEEAGREVRREVFYRVMKEHGGTKIALAHHMNDNVETFFLNVSRGTGLKGLGGIRPAAGEIIRPLLCLRRQEIELFLKEQNIAYCTDQTNISDDYTRNRLRNHIVPYFEREINSNTVVHIHETMEQLREIQAYMDAQKEEWMQKCVISSSEKERSCIVLGESFAAVPDVLKPLILKSVLAETAGREKDIASVHLKVLQSLFEKQVGRKVNLPYEVEAVRIYDGICLKKQILEKKAEIAVQIFPEGQREQIILAGGKKITCRILEKKEITGFYPQKNDTKWFDYDIIPNGLIIRTRRPGDYITICTKDSEKELQRQKLKSYFINEKIPQEERAHILLVAEDLPDAGEGDAGAHILWIVGHRAGCMYQVTGNTRRVLEIKLEE